MALRRDVDLLEVEIITDRLILRNDLPNRFAGCAGLHHPESPTPEIGIWLAEDSHRIGLGLKAVEVICNRAADEVECDYIRYPVDRANGPSRKIPESPGAEIEDEYGTITPDGRILNTVEYRIYPQRQTPALQGPKRSAG